MQNPHPTLRRLNAEWHSLAALPVSERWAATSPVLAGHDDLGAVLAAVRPAPDAVLGALLAVADATARRVVLQAMLPRAVRDAARDREHDLDDYLGELWLGIAGYPLARRPTSIAANLALDTRKRVRAREPGVPVDPANFVSLPAPELRSEIDPLLALARRSHLIDATTEHTLRLVYQWGLPGTQAAAILGVTPAVVHQRCRRAVRRLAAHASELADAVG